MLGYSSCTVTTREIFSILPIRRYIGPIWVATASRVLVFTPTASRTSRHPRIIIMLRRRTALPLPLLRPTMLPSLLRPIIALRHLTITPDLRLLTIMLNLRLPTIIPNLPPLLIITPGLPPLPADLPAILVALLAVADPLVVLAAAVLADADNLIRIALACTGFRLACLPLRVAFWLFQ